MLRLLEYNKDGTLEFCSTEPSQLIACPPFAAATALDRLADCYREVGTPRGSRTKHVASTTQLFPERKERWEQRSLQSAVIGHTLRHKADTYSGDESDESDESTDDGQPPSAIHVSKRQRQQWAVKATDAFLDQLYSLQSPKDELDKDGRFASLTLVLDAIVLDLRSMTGLSGSPRANANHGSAGIELAPTAVLRPLLARCGLMTHSTGDMAVNGLTAVIQNTSDISVIVTFLTTISVASSQLRVPVQPSFGGITDDVAARYVACGGVPIVVLASKAEEAVHSALLLHRVFVEFSARMLSASQVSRFSVVFSVPLRDDVTLLTEDLSSIVRTGRRSRSDDKNGLNVTGAIMVTPPATSPSRVRPLSTSFLSDPRGESPKLKRAPTSPRATDALFSNTSTLSGNGAPSLPISAPAAVDVAVSDIIVSPLKGELPSLAAPASALLAASAASGPSTRVCCQRQMLINVPAFLHLLAELVAQQSLPEPQNHFKELSVGSTSGDSSDAFQRLASTGARALVAASLVIVERHVAVACRYTKVMAGALLQQRRFGDAREEALRALVVGDSSASFSGGRGTAGTEFIDSAFISFVGAAAGSLDMAEDTSATEQVIDQALSVFLSLTAVSRDLPLLTSDVANGTSLFQPVQTINAARLSLSSVERGPLGHLVAFAAIDLSKTASEALDHSSVVVTSLPLLCSVIHKPLVRMALGLPSGVSSATVRGGGREATSPSAKSLGRMREAIANLTGPVEEEFCLATEDQNRSAKTGSSQAFADAFRTEVIDRLLHPQNALSPTKAGPPSIAIFATSTSATPIPNSQHRKIATDSGMMYLHGGSPPAADTIGAPTSELVADHFAKREVLLDTVLQWFLPNLESVLQRESLAHSEEMKAADKITNALLNKCADHEATAKSCALIANQLSAKVLQRKTSDLAAISQLKATLQNELRAEIEAKLVELEKRIATRRNFLLSEDFADANSPGANHSMSQVGASLHMWRSPNSKSNTGRKAHQQQQQSQSQGNKQGLMNSSEAGSPSYLNAEIPSSVSKLFSLSSGHLIGASSPTYISNRQSSGVIEGKENSSVHFLESSPPSSKLLDDGLQRKRLRQQQNQQDLIGAVESSPFRRRDSVGGGSSGHPSPFKEPHGEDDDDEEALLRHSSIVNDVTLRMLKEFSACCGHWLTDILAPALSKLTDIVTEQQGPRHDISVSRISMSPSPLSNLFAGSPNVTFAHSPNFHSGANNAADDEIGNLVNKLLSVVGGGGLPASSRNVSPTSSPRKLGTYGASDKVTPPHSPTSALRSAQQTSPVMLGSTSNSAAKFTSPAATVVIDRDLLAWMSDTNLTEGTQGSGNLRSRWEDTAWLQQQLRAARSLIGAARASIGRSQNETRPPGYQLSSPTIAHKSSLQPQSQAPPLRDRTQTPDRAVGVKSLTALLLSDDGTITPRSPTARQTERIALADHSLVSAEASRRKDHNDSHATILIQRLVRDLERAKQDARAAELSAAKAQAYAADRQRELEATVAILKNNATAGMIVSYNSHAQTVDGDDIGVSSVVNRTFLTPQESLSLDYANHLLDKERASASNIQAAFDDLKVAHDRVTKRERESSAAASDSAKALRQLQQGSQQDLRDIKALNDRLQEENVRLHLAEAKLRGELGVTSRREQFASQTLSRHEASSLNSSNHNHQLEAFYKEGKRIRETTTTYSDPYPATLHLRAPKGLRSPPYQSSVISIDRSAGDSDLSFAALTNIRGRHLYANRSSGGSFVAAGVPIPLSPPGFRTFAARQAALSRMIERDVEEVIAITNNAGAASHQNEYHEGAGESLLGVQRYSGGSHTQHQSAPPSPLVASSTARGDEWTAANGSFGELIRNPTRPPKQHDLSTATNASNSSKVWDLLPKEQMSPRSRQRSEQLLTDDEDRISRSTSAAAVETRIPANESIAVSNSSFAPPLSSAANNEHIHFAESNRQTVQSSLTTKGGVAAALPPLHSINASSIHSRSISERSQTATAAPVYTYPTTTFPQSSAATTALRHGGTAQYEGINETHRSMAASLSANHRASATSQSLQTHSSASHRKNVTTNTVSLAISNRSNYDGPRPFAPHQKAFEQIHHFLEE